VPAAVQRRSRKARAALVAGAVLVVLPLASGAPQAAATPAPHSVGDRPTTMIVRASAYALRGRTASGVLAGRGIVAVDPAVIPLGTRLTIPGYGNGIAADIGSAVRGRKIDIWFASRARTLAWGERTVTVTLH
jgi:3D (Asp-Asp-Asp) domain-containing protein